MSNFGDKQLQEMGIIVFNFLQILLPNEAKIPGNGRPTALWLLKRIYRPGHIYQKAGVILNVLVPKAGVQRDLFFDEADSQLDKRTRVTLALDEINQRFGRQTLRIASQGFKSPWKMKQTMKSPGYTTDWNGLIQAT